MPKPELSIVCGTRNRPVEFARFMRSVHAAATVPTEVLIADASDTFLYAAGCTEIGDFVDRVEVVEEVPRLGMVQGYNQLFRLAQADYAAWFNDDCELLPGWDRIAVDFMNNYPLCGCGIIYFRDPGMTQFYYQTYHQLAVPNFGIVPKTVGDEVGWFGNVVKMYGCDTFLGLALIDQNWAVLPIPGCKVIHHRTLDEERKRNTEGNQQEEDAARLAAHFGRESDWPTKCAELRSKHQKFQAIVAPTYTD